MFSVEKLSEKVRPKMMNICLRIKMMAEYGRVYNRQTNKNKNNNNQLLISHIVKVKSKRFVLL